MNIEVLKEQLSEETYNAVAAELEGKDIKLANLSTGEYVSWKPSSTTPKPC